MLHVPFIFPSLWLNFHALLNAAPVLPVTVPVGLTWHCEQSAG